MQEHVLLKIANLKKYYRDKSQTIKALDGISLDIYKGEILGLLGVNGAGKTTLSAILTTLYPPTSGDVLIKNQSIYKNINNYRRIVGYCPQTPNLVNELTVEQNLLFAGRYFGLPEDEIIERMNDLVERYELAKYLKSKPQILSGGYNHRVLLARSLMHNPKILILDEPTVGLDPHIRRQLWENISAIKKEGVTVILTTHYLDEAEILADRICILDKGKIKLIDTTENLRAAYNQSRLEDIFIKLTHEEVKV